MTRKVCKIDAAPEVEQEILDCSVEVRQQIGDFLVRLQENPLPKGRQENDKGAYSFQLPCGIFVGWEIIGDPLHLVFRGPDETILVRILGVGWERVKWVVKR
ncbi:MAG: hypothetical protein WB341_04705 [Terracidiphilus sp.]